MKPFPKSLSRSLHYTFLCLSICCKYWRTCKSKYYPFFKFTNNIFMHFSKLASMTFIKNKYYFFVK